jgi:3-deoxy-D-manno-octulosonic-acid transferase
MGELENIPGLEIVLTTTTSTGYAVACQLYKDKVRHIGFFPLDFWAFSATAWRRLKPDVAFLMESELWPEHLYQAKKRNVPVILLNGRLSDRSLRRYRFVKGLLKKMLAQVSLVLTSSKLDKEHFLSMGVDSRIILNVGNLKIDSNLQVSAQEELMDLKKAIGIDRNATILLGASTWPGEEALLLDVFRRAMEMGIDVRLILVPRHVERRGEIAALLNKCPYTWKLRTDGVNARRNVQIYVVDTTGEQRLFVQLADVVFVGKSLPPNVGGQSPIEAAALGKPIVYGPNMTNFKAICRSLEAEQAVIRANDPQDAASELLNLLKDKEKRSITGQTASKWYDSQRGAARRTAEILRNFLGNM